MIKDITAMKEFRSTSSKQLSYNKISSEDDLEISPRNFYF